MIRKKALYVHIPFCDDICSYCAFSKVFYKTNLSSKYLDSLENELLKYKDYKFYSIYIGGGTPTCLSIKELERLFLMLKPYQDETSLITIESNLNLNEEKVALLAKYDVKRVSLGVQTFDEDYLKLINRDSSYAKVNKVINLLNKYNINNINIDLIYGFNDQSISRLDNDLIKFVSLPVQHISTYCLQVEEGTRLFNMSYKEAEDELASRLYSHIVDVLALNGFARYEVSNFAKPGFESFHNLVYWNNEEYGAVGLAASSYIDNYRYTNTKSISEYLKGNYEDYKEKVTLEDKKFYFLMVGLRKTKGVSLKEYSNCFKSDLLKEKENEINDLIACKDIEINGDLLSICPDKMFIMDYILRKLLF